MVDTVAIVSLVDIKRQLRVDFVDDDELLVDKLEAARKHIEAWVGPLDDFEDGVPGDIMEAICQHAAHLYENREATTLGDDAALVPLGYYDLIGPYRKWEF